jgi:hypothetical protein
LTDTKSGVLTQSWIPVFRWHDSPRGFCWKHQELVDKKARLELEEDGLSRLTLTQVQRFFPKKGHFLPFEKIHIQ